MLRVLWMLRDATASSVDRPSEALRRVVDATIAKSLGML